MENNRNKADQEFQNALRMIHEKDYSGARNAVLKSKTLNSEREGVEPLLEILNVLVYAHTNTDGECDWYGVLGVDPSDSEAVIKKAYRRKSLVIHPDKNKMPGADEAFKLVDKAWKLLQDHDQRTYYDWERRLKLFKENPITYNFMFPEQDAYTSGSVPFGSSNCENTYKKDTVNPTPPPKDTSPQAPAPEPQTEKKSTDCANTKPKARKEPSESSPKPKPQLRKYTKRSKSEKSRPAKGDTFWTVCTNCRMQYEYERIYQNVKLTCPAPECKKFFPAIEIAPPRKAYERKQSATKGIPKSNKSSNPSKATQGDSSPLKTPKSPMPPIFATPITTVPGYMTAHNESRMSNNENLQQEYEEDIEAIFLGQRVSGAKGVRIEEPSEKEETLQKDLGMDHNAAKNSRDKGKGVVIEEPSGKEWNFFF